MPVPALNLPADPALALEFLREASRKRPALVFKRSPICPVSFQAEAELAAFLRTLEDADPESLALAKIDVIEERPLARGLTAALDVRHESPQALLFARGALAWHGSHAELTRTRFAEELEGAAAAD